MRSNIGGRVLALVIALVVCAGCGDQVVSPAATPSPTIAAARPPSPSPKLPGITIATRVPSPSSAPALPTAASSAASAAPPAPSAVSSAPSAAPSAATAASVQFSYLWPAYLPPGVRVSPNESRVAREGEIGDAGLGFFIVTFASGPQKLVIGGGATETLPLTGDQRRITVGSRQATLITNGDQRQIVFDVTRGSLFVFGSGFSEEELLHIAGSLEPIDVGELRTRVGGG